MKKIVLIVGCLFFLTGCTAGYKTDDTISPPLEGLQEPEDFLNTGFEMNHDISVAAANNLAARL